MITNTIARRVMQTQSLVKIPIRTIIPHTSSNVVSGAPRNRIPFVEKVGCGIFIAACILATPTWVLLHMNDYRKLE